jgi:hypothetical protein
MHYSQRNVSPSSIANLAFTPLTKDAQNILSSPLLGIASLLGSSASEETLKSIIKAGFSFQSTPNQLDRYPLGLSPAESSQSLLNSPPPRTFRPEPRLPFEVSTAQSGKVEVDQLPPIARSQSSPSSSCEEKQNEETNEDDCSEFTEALTNKRKKVWRYVSEFDIDSDSTLIFPFSLSF